MESKQLNSLHQHGDQNNASLYLRLRRGAEPPADGEGEAAAPEREEGEQIGVQLERGSGGASDQENEETLRVVGGGAESGHFG